jgi:alkylation response protein AidB-like acyl-CoA dehydrogenase
VVPVHSNALQPYAATLGTLIRQFGLRVQAQLIRHREEILERQLVQEPIAEAAMELYACVCVLSRLDAETTSPQDNPLASRMAPVARLFLKQATRRIREAFRRLNNNDDRQVESVGAGLIESRSEP